MTFLEKARESTASPFSLISDPNRKLASVAWLAPYNIKRLMGDLNRKLASVSWLAPYNIKRLMGDLNRKLASVSWLAPYNIKRLMSKIGVGHRKYETNIFICNEWSQQEASVSSVDDSL